MPEVPIRGPQLPPKKGFSLFTKKKQVEGPNISDTLNQVNEVARRLRIIESRYTDLNRKSQVTEKNMLNERKIINNEIKTLDSDILELKRTINKIQTKVDTIVSELTNLASKEDFESLRKYMDLWEPINFATKKEVENMIKEMIEEKK